MIKQASIPQTDSIAELAKFWDTHDVTDFEDELEEVTESVFAQTGNKVNRYQRRDESRVFLEGGGRW